jgi:Zn-finger nucleic acid-binding protein
MRVVYLCPRCGSVLVDRGGEPRRLELAATRQPTLANWRSYAHQTLTAAEWQRIAAGGASDA